LNGENSREKFVEAELEGDLALARSPFGLDAANDYCAFGCFVSLSEAAPELEVPFFFFSLIVKSCGCF
jgi:hypothetical protein